MSAALALSLAASLAASQPAVARPADDVSSSVTIDVVVDDSRGRSVESLTPSDFSVAEGGTSLQIQSVRFVRGRGTASVAGDPTSIAPAAITDDSRLFAIYLDEFHVTPGPAADHVRATLAAFVRDQLGQRDFLVVLKPLQSILDIKLTSDREAIAQAIEAFAPRRGDLVPRTTFEEKYIAGEPARIEAARAQIVASSLQSLATQLSPYAPVRKTLIIVSEGLGRGVRRWAGEPQSSTDSIALAANRAHVSIYTIDPMPATTGDASESATADRAMRDALRSLADRTSGRPLPSGDGLGASLTGTLSDASGYYALTVAAAPSTDGRYHPLAVSVRRQDVAVRARSGYWSASRAEIAALNPPMPTLPFSAQFVHRMSPLVRPWFGMTRGADGATRVSFVWEPMPRVPGDRSKPVVPARVALTVTTADGEPVYEGVVLPSEGSPLDPGANRALATFDSPIGRLLVRMAIEDETSQVVDRDVRDVIVNGFRGPVALGTAYVFRARNAREFGILQADPSAAPVASRVFSRTERLLIRVPVVSTGAVPVVNARLLGGGGRAMRTLTVTPALTSPSTFEMDVPLAALPAGSYTVEFGARSDRGDARDSVSFRVTP